MPRTRTQWLQTLLIVVVLLPLLAHMVNGLFVRMVADDYCFTDDVYKKGWWGAMTYEYTQWSGAYSSTAVQDGIVLLGATAVRWLPMLLLGLWLVGMIWLVYEVGKLTHIRSPGFVALFIGSLIVFATVDGTVNIFQSLYWTASSSEYVAPFGLMCLYAGYLLHLIRRPPQGKQLLLACFLSALLAFIIGGFSPIHAPLQVVVLLLALATIWRFAPPEVKRPLLTVLGIGLLSAVIALVIVVIAPGNAVRQSHFSPPTSMIEVGLLSLEFAASFVAIQVAFMSPLPLLLVLCMAGGIGWYERTQRHQESPGMKWVGQWLLLFSVTGFILFVVCVAPAVYGTGRMIPARAFIVPQLILVIMTLSWGYIMGWAIKTVDQPTRILRYAGMVLVVGLLLISPVRSALNTLVLIPDFNAFANEWDLRDSQIRAAVANGTTELTMPPFSVDLADYIGTDTSEVNNGHYTCAQRYYGLTSLVVAPS